ncbi:MAG: DUF2778 domain-containing protein [Caulobacter sp.]|nr:DUF2778 domain-containing protein [Caulobacter sp.]
MWTYQQASGLLLHDGHCVGQGYSGAGTRRRDGRDNPEMEAAVGRGPIPRGRWRIGPPRYSRRVGPHAMDLSPLGHDAHGRSAFMIHGDNAAGDASRGCIILSRALRERISGSGDHDLEVVG